MAVYTDVPAEELAALLNGYDLGELAVVQGHRRGRGEFQLPAARRATAITSSRSTRSGWRGDLPFFLALMEHLHARGITCPQPVKNRNGEMLGKLCGRPAAIVTFLDRHVDAAARARHCRAVGQALARHASCRRAIPRRRAERASVAGWRRSMSRP